MIDGAHKIKIKHILALSVFIFFFLIAVVVFINYRDNKTIDDSDSSETVPVYEYGDLCNKDDIGTAFKARYAVYTTESLADLDPLVNEIKQKDNSDSAINCQFILATYNGNMGNFAEAIDNYKKILSINDKFEVWIDETIIENTKEDIEEIIRVYEEQKNQIEGLLERNLRPSETPVDDN